MTNTPNYVALTRLAERLRSDVAPGHADYISKAGAADILDAIAQEESGLLEALNDLVSRVDDDPNFVPHSEALIRARAAITKATT